MSLMRDILLACATVAMFAFVYCIMRQVDRLVAQNRQALAENCMEASSLVRIAAETPALLHTAALAMDFCSSVHPYILFSLSSGKVTTLLRRLQEGSVDLVLLREETAQSLHTGFPSLELDCGESLSTEEAGLPVEELDCPSAVCLLWNPDIPSAVRDRVIFVLRSGPNTFGRSQTGSA